MLKKITKLFTVCLTFAILCGTCDFATIRVLASDENLLGSQWDFEKNELGTFGFSSTQGLSIISDGAAGSSKALKITGTSTYTDRLITGLRTNTEYTVKYWAKMDGKTGNVAIPNLGIKDYGAEDVFNNGFSNVWEEHKFTFKTGPSNNTARLYIFIYGGEDATGNLNFYIDNLTVQEKTASAPVITPFDKENLLGNGWSFEADDIELLGTSQGSADDGDKYYSTGYIKIVSGGYESESLKSLRISGVNIGNGKRIEGLKENTKYRLTFYAKAENMVGSPLCNIGVKEYSVTLEENVKTIVSDRWTKYECNFTTGNQDTSALIFTWIYSEQGTDSADLYVDDMLLQEVQEDVVEGNSTTPEQEENTTKILGNRLPGLNESDPDPYTYTKNPKLKWFFPLLFVVFVETAVILGWGGYIVISKRKQKQKQAGESL